MTLLNIVHLMTLKRYNKTTTLSWEIQLMLNFAIRTSKEEVKHFSKHI